MNFMEFCKINENEFYFRNVSNTTQMKLYIVSSMLKPHKLYVGDIGADKLTKNDVISFHFEKEVITLNYSMFFGKQWFTKVVTCIYEKCKWVLKDE